jgi:sarcosine oxidase subunit gamma
MAEITPRSPAALVQVTAWPGTAATVEHRIALLPATRLPVGPGRWLLASDQPLDFDLPAELGTVTDLTDARVILHLAGEDVVHVLRQGVGFDLDPRRFGSGASAQTSIHGMPVLVHRRDLATFDLYVSSSFAASLEAWLREAAGLPAHEAAPSG